MPQRNSIGDMPTGTQGPRQPVGKQRVVFNDKEAHDLLYAAALRARLAAN